MELQFEYETDFGKCGDLVEVILKYQGLKVGKFGLKKEPYLFLFKKKGVIEVDFK